jgi:hypothetical protein
LSLKNSKKRELEQKKGKNQRNLVDTAFFLFNNVAKKPEKRVTNE